MSEPRPHHGWTDHETALAAVNAGQRERLFADMRAWLAWAEKNPNAPIPLAPVMNVRVPDDERAAYVAAFAKAYGVPVQIGEDGCHKAIRRFGAVTLEAHFTPAAAQVENHRRLLHSERPAA